MMCIGAVVDAPQAPVVDARYQKAAMELLNIFPTILLALMIVLTLVLLPLINDDDRHAHRRDDEQSSGSTDELRIVKRLK